MKNIEALNTELAELNGVAKTLQNENRAVSDTRVLFYGFIEDCLSMSGRLKPSSYIILRHMQGLRE